MKDLQDKLRTMSEHIDPESETFWKEAITPILPREPLKEDFLRETLAPLHSLNQAIVLEFLARLGRSEVAGIAAELLEKRGLAGIETIDLGVALARCGDPRGLKALEALFHHSFKHPKDKGVSVPLEWIVDDTLRVTLGTPEALALRQRLVAIENSGRSSKN